MSSPAATTSLASPSAIGNRRLCFALFLLLFCAGAGLRIAALRGVAVRSPDERTYAWEAAQVADRGVSGFQSLVVAFQNRPSLVAYPSPARAGYIEALALVMRLTGRRDAATGARLSCIADIRTLFLVGLIGWRFFSPPAAVIALLLYAASPPVLAMARRGWQEPCVAFLAALLLLVALEADRQPSRWWLAVAAGLLVALNITIKETAMVAAALILLLLLVALVRRRAWRQVALLLASAATGAILCALWLAHLLGGFAVWMAFTSHTVVAAGSEPYALGWQSGSPFTWLQMLCISDSVLVPLGLVGLGIAACSGRRLRNPAILWPAILAVAFLVLPLCSAHHLNLRFAAPAFVPLALLGAWAACAIAAAFPRFLPGNEVRWTRRAARAVLLCAAFINVLSFQERFVQTDLQDLSAGMILDAPVQP
jgi:4-amino-4-deoxy-L-arabinose transferase-like glycosyltransferase